jgi:ribosomal protein S27E
MSVKSEAHQTALTCLLCGGDRFSDGEVPSYGQMQFVQTFPDGRKPAGQPVQARKCEQCGNIQLFARPSR